MKKEKPDPKKYTDDDDFMTVEFRGFKLPPIHITVWNNDEQPTETESKKP